MWSSFTKWFQKQGKDEDYENVLAAIALDIQKRQTKLSEIRVRERRATLLATMYTLGLWCAYVSAWYVGAVPGTTTTQRRRSEVRRMVAAAPVVVGPVVILFIRRIVQMWYTWIGDAEEKTLKGLLKEQRSKVEEVKKKTNYYSTRNLIERYDDASRSPMHRQLSPGHVPPLPMTPPRVPMSPPNALSPGMMSPAPEPSRQWYDRLLDALVGESEEERNEARTRYALICSKCFTHNGLVKESMFEDTEYVCPKCGHFNSARSKARREAGQASGETEKTEKTPEKTSGDETRDTMDVD